MLKTKKKKKVAIANEDFVVTAACGTPLTTLAEYIVQASDVACMGKHVATGESYREWADKIERNGAAVCLCICPNTGKFLLDLRGDHVEHSGKYGLPGGALDDDESPTQGALRELYEETGKRVKKVDSVIKLANKLWLVVVTVRKPFEPRISEESAMLEWHTKLPAKSKLHPAMAKSFAMYKELIRNTIAEKATATEEG